MAKMPCSPRDGGAKLWEAPTRLQTGTRALEAVRMQPPAASQPVLLHTARFVLLWSSPSSGFLENNYPFHQQPAPGNAPIQQMNRGKSLTEMDAKKRPGRCRQEWREAAPFCGTPQNGRKICLESFPSHTTLSITCNAPKLQVSLENSMQTSHMESTIWKCFKTSYIWQLLSMFKEKRKRQQHHKPSHLPSNRAFIQWLIWLTHSILLYWLNHNNLKHPFSASVCLESKSTELH